MKHAALKSIVGGRHEAGPQAPCQGASDRSAATEMLLRELSQLQVQAGRLVAAVEAADDEPHRAGGDKPQCAEGVIRDILQARLERNSHFPAHLFSDPAWDMLLDLYAAELAQIRVSVTSLCIASNVPTSTALRWISALEDEGLIQRDPDPLDARRFFMSLTETASQAFRNYFSGTAGRLTVL